ncbi:winged helix-turn-helix domain-containing protein [Sphaerisporangium sp. NPDC005288]|uniref:winged helix-turn-helix domain-containing protein n=1 Tax=Sphaerisporangium sp. NPDC005288 TaxID=3155114 RepID=UPI0033A79121
MVKKTGRPGYLQIADELREQIRRGTLAPGDPLPSTARLSEDYDASLSVVKMAVGILRNEGLVIGQQGKGVYVREIDTAPGDTPTATADELTEIRASIKELTERLERVESALSQQTGKPRRSSRS